MYYRAAGTSKSRQYSDAHDFNHTELFAGGDAAHIWPPGDGKSIDWSRLAIYHRFARIWGADFKRVVYATFDGKDQSEPPTRHIVADMCASAGIKGPISVRPYLALTEDEKARSVWANGQIVIQSDGMGGAILPMRNKQWYAAHFQEVVDRLRGEFESVSGGQPQDPALGRRRSSRPHEHKGDSSYSAQCATVYRRRRFSDASCEGRRLPRRDHLRWPRSALAIRLYMQFKSVFSDPLRAMLALEFM